MPKHKIQKQDEIPTEDWHQLLALAKNLDFTKVRILPKIQIKEKKKLQVIPTWFSCVLAIIWLTGKRVNEVLSLRRRQIIFINDEIRIKFFVGKKRSRGSPLELQPYQKARNIKHQAVPYIQEYLEIFDQFFKESDYLFSAKTQPRHRIIHTKFINGQQKEETRQYDYDDYGGYVYEENARYWLKLINEKLPKNKRIYFHYGRHSIGLKMAFKGCTPYQIADVLDETVNAALAYTKHAGGYSLEWTRETE